MSVRTVEELEGLRRIGGIVADTLVAMGDAVRPGMTTSELDDLGERLLGARGADPAPRAAYGFPGATCISVNDEIAHGIPGPRMLRRGDVVNIDVSASLDGYVADTGASFPVGTVGRQVRALCRAGRRALDAGVAAVAAGRRFAELGLAVESVVRRHGFQVIRDLTGHGVGRALHEEPSDVRSFFEPRDRRRMTEGLVFTIEPMISPTARWSRLGSDGWTLRTADGSRAVQFEHTVVATSRGAVVVTLPGAS